MKNIENTDLYNEIFLTVNKKVRNFHTAEEITQEVFMDLAKKILTQPGICEDIYILYREQR